MQFITYYLLSHYLDFGLFPSLYHYWFLSQLLLVLQFPHLLKKERPFIRVQILLSTNTWQMIIVIVIIQATLFHFNLWKWFKSFLKERYKTGKKKLFLRTCNNFISQLVQNRWFEFAAPLVKYWSDDSFCLIAMWTSSGLCFFPVLSPSANRLNKKIFCIWLKRKVILLGNAQPWFENSDSL